MAPGFDAQDPTTTPTSPSPGPPHRLLDDRQGQAPLRIRRATLQLGEHPEPQDANGLPLDLDVESSW